MHKVLPLLILLVLGGMVVYTITQPGANFNPIEFAYDLQPPPGPKATPSGFTDPPTYPYLKPLDPGKPSVKCITSGDKCVSGIVCCDGYCDRSSGSPICKKYNGVECLPRGTVCYPGTNTLQCCGGSSLCQDIGNNGFYLCVSQAIIR